MPDLQRMLCLVPIPFTDLSSTKRRPVIVLSNKNHASKSDDLIVAAVTSNPDERPFSLPLVNADMENGFLLKESRIRPDKIYTIHSSLVIKQFGKIKTEKYSEIIQAIQLSIAPE